MRYLALVFASLELAACGRRAQPPAEPPGYAGPEISLAVPSPGSFLLQGGVDLSPVEVAGQACDPVHALSGLSIAGTPVSLGGSGSCRSFDVVLPARLGLNVVRGEVVNDAGETGSLAQAFIRSPGYFGLGAGSPDARAASGLVLRVGPAFVDDGDRNTPDDAATLAERVLQSLDLDAAAGDFRMADPDADRDGHIDLVSYDCLFWTQRNKRTGFEAWKGGLVTRAAVAVDSLALTDGGLAARIAVSGLRVPISVTGNVDSGCLGDAQMSVSGAAVADELVLEGRAAVGLDALGRPAASFALLTATLVGLRLDIDLGPLLDWTGLGSVVGDAIAAQVRGPVQGAIAAAVRTLLDDRLSRLLAGLAELRTTVVLPPALGGVELVVEGAVDAMELTPAGALLASAIQVHPAAPRPEHLGEATPGAMRMGASLPAADLGTAAVGLGLAEDVVNQFLHAAWLGGAFDADDLAQRVDLGLPGARLAVFSRLPPVIMPRQAGAPGLDLGWGGVDFDLVLPGLLGGAEIAGTLSLVLPVDGVEADAGGIRPVFGVEPAVEVQVLDVNWEPRPQARAMARQLVQGAMRSLLPRLLAQATGAFPLPPLDLRAVDPSLPALVLSFADPRAARAGGYLLLAADVTAVP